MQQSGRLLLLCSSVAVAACSAQDSGAADGPRLLDARGEGLAFRDKAVSLADLAPPRRDGARPADGRDHGVPPRGDLAPPQPDAAPSTCPTTWAPWACAGNPLTGCTATCDGSKYKLTCNGLGGCTCSVGALVKTCPSMPFPPPLPGCTLCSTSLAAKCCQLKM